MRPIRVVAIALAMAVGAAPAASGQKRKPSGFKPKAIAGSYAGSWTNETFGSTGTFDLVIRTARRGRVLTLVPSAGGNGFGCPSVPAFPTLRIAKGKGATGWTRKGFRLTAAGDFGELTARYVHQTGALTASGTAPPACAPGITYTIAGTLKRGVLSGTAAIALPSQTATTRFTASKR